MGVRRQRLLWSLGVILSMCLTLTTNVLAEKDQTKETRDDQFGVQAIIPDNQIDLNKSFFDLRVKPGDKQDLIIKVINKGEKTLKLSVEANNAYTTDSGLIAYDKKDTKNIVSANPDFSTLSKVDTSVIELEPKEAKEAKVSLNIPDKEFDGLVLGGIMITQIITDNKPSIDKSIKTKQSIVTGVRLSMNDRDITPEINLLSVEGSNQGNSHITTVFENQKPVIISDVQLVTKIYPKNDPEDLLLENKQVGLKIAPNSLFQYHLPLVTESLSAGDYRLISEITSSQGNWTFEKIFHLDEDLTANQVKDPVVEKKLNIWWLIIILVLIIIASVLMYLYRKNKKKELSHMKRVNRVRGSKK